MRPKSRRKFLKGAGTAGVIGLAGCIGGGGGGGGGGGEGGKIKVGMIESLTGPFAPPGKRRLWATRAAIDKVNKEGGLNGRKIELLVRDTETDPGVATTKAQELINRENVKLLCGTFSSSVCLAVGPIATRAKVPYSAGYCATRALTGKDCTKYAFRGTRSNAAIQWIAMGPYMYDELGYESASIIYADYSWGQSERRQFKKYYEGDVASEVAVPAGTTDFSPYLSKVDTDVDAMVYIQAGGDSLNLLNQVGNFGIHKEVELVTTGAGVGEFMAKAGVPPEVANKLHTINYYPKGLSGPLDTEANQKFHDKYAEFSEGEPIPTRSSSTGWEAIHVFKKIADQIGYGDDGFSDAKREKFVNTWRGLQMEQSYAFPQGTKRYRKDNQCILDQYVTDIQPETIGGGSAYLEKIVDTVPRSVADETPITCSKSFAQ